MSKYWNDRDKFYIQTNNPTEIFLKKIGYSQWLETCGPTTLVNCIASLGVNVEVETFGNYKPQPESVVMDFFHDSKNYPLLKKARPNVEPSEIVGNRVPQYYPVAAWEIFRVKSYFKFVKDFKFVTNELIKGKAIQLQLKEPGHYIAAVHFDAETSEIVYNDSRPRGQDGFNKRLNSDYYYKNIENFIVVYGE